MTLDEIATLARAFARARETLETITEEIEGERRQAVRRRLRALKARIADAKVAEAELRAALAQAPGLFTKPRTRAFDGVRVGYRKMPGRFEIADEARAIGRVRDKLPAHEAALVRVKESLNRAALKGLDARDLAKIGVAAVDTDDEIVIETPSSDLDKLVDALLADDDLAAAA